MSEKGKAKSLNSIANTFRSGEETIELLLALVWSPLETLQRRGLVRIFVGKGAVAVIFHKTDLVPHLGLVPTDEKSVGSDAAVSVGNLELPKKAAE